MNTLRQIFRDRWSKIVLGLFIFMLVNTIVAQGLGMRETFFNHVTSLFLGFIPNVGFIVGVIRSRQWGGRKSVIGRSLVFIGLAMLAWASGSYIWSYYNFFLGNEMPYPSWADAGYAPFYWLMGIGLVMLFSYTSLQTESSTKGRIYFFCIPILMAIVTYYFIFLQLHGGAIWQTSEPLKVFVDLYYPLADVAILTIIVLTSGLAFNFLGERLRLPITLLITGLIFNYVADFYFSYDTTVGSYYVGGPADILFGCAMFLLSLGISNLHPRLLEDK